MHTPFSQSVQDVDAWVNRMALNALQDATPGQMRHHVAQIVATIVNEGLGMPDPGPPPTAIAKAAGELREEGYTRLDPLLTTDQINEVVSYFSARPCFNAHVWSKSDKVPRQLGFGAEGHHYGCYPLVDVLEAPHLLELANHPNILALAQSYLGCVPTLYSMNCWWTFPGLGRAPASQEFHRDRDDFKFCTLFIYLTDVGPENSPHLFIRRTHRVDFLRDRLAKAADRLRTKGANIDLESDSSELNQTLGYLYRTEADHGHDTLYNGLFGDLVDTIVGPAGTAFIADTNALHKGVPATKGRRLMAWARYGLYRNSIVPLDEIEPIARSRVAGRLQDDSLSRYINRCLIEANSVGLQR